MRDDSPLVRRHDLKQVRVTPDEAYAGGVMARNRMAEDVGEGIDALIEKRPPTWRHR